MPSETASAIATTSSAPLRCAISATAATSSMVPKKFGDWISTHAVSSVIACSRAASVQPPGIEERDLGDRHALVPGVADQHFAVLRVHAARHHRSVPSGHARRHHHRLGRGGRAVVHGGVRHLHAGQLADHGLKFEDGLQGALRHLRLVRRVGGEELAARDQRVDQHRAVVVVRAGAQEIGVGGRRRSPPRAAGTSPGSRLPPSKAQCSGRV